MGKYFRRFAVLALAAVSAISFGQNVVVQLADGGSTAQLNVGTSASSGPLGLNSFTVGGIQEVSQQVFLLSVNGAGVQPLNDLSTPTVNQVSAREAVIGYSSSNFTVSVDNTLTGANSVTGVLTEALTLINTSASTITYNLVDLNHYKLDGANGGTVARVDSNDILQTRNVTTGSYGVNITPTHWAINTFSSVASAGLGGGNLSDGTSPFTNADPGFAFQWQGSLGTGQSLQVGTFHIVTIPEPASLLTLGGLAFMALRRRKRAARP